MSVTFTPVGTLAANPFAADADPNTAAPLAARLFEIPDRDENGDLTSGLKFYTAYTTPSGAGQTLNGTVWVRDEGTGNFVKSIDFTALAELDGVQVDNVAPGIVFIQITGISAGTVDTISFFAAPL